MTIAVVIQDRFERSFTLWRDLTDALGEPELESKLATLPSNTIGAQLWCVVGARESYSRAIEAGHWSGFSCSLTDTADPAKVREALLRSEAEVRNATTAIADADDARAGYIIDLLEHEAAHQGQIIRYLYGLRLSIPKSWKSRYALD